MEDFWPCESVYSEVYLDVIQYTAEIRIDISEPYFRDVEPVRQKAVIL